MSKVQKLSPSRLKTLVKEELESYCTTTPNMVDLSIFIKDIPYEDYVYED